jgi:hypothetical protein
MGLMPVFCRHNRLLANCPICTREQGAQMNPVVSSSAPRTTAPRERSSGATPASERLGGTARSAAKGRSGRAAERTRAAANAVKVRRLERGVDDGYVSTLIQGVRSSADAARLADELAFAATRLDRLAGDPPARFAAIVDPERDLEERTWAAVQWAADPERTPVSWSSGEGLDAYRAWAARAGSQAAAITGEGHWTPTRRFERIFERIGALGALDRDQRYELLVLLGCLGLYQLEAGRLFPSGENETTWAAKRAFGIGDPLLLERRAAELAEVCGVPLAALDLGLANWGAGSAARSGRGVEDDMAPDPDRVAAARAALGV